MRAPCFGLLVKFPLGFKVRADLSCMLSCLLAIPHCTSGAIPDDFNQSCQQRYDAGIRTETSHPSSKRPPRLTKCANVGFLYSESTNRQLQVKDCSSGDNDAHTVGVCQWFRRHWHSVTPKKFF